MAVTAPSTGQQLAEATASSAPAAATGTANLPQVTYENGLLSIRAENSTLRDVLRAVRGATGASIDFPDIASEPISVDLGPGRSGEVLAALLNSARYDYILVGSEEANSIARVIVTTRRDAGAATRPNGEASNYQMPSGESAQAPAKSASELKRLLEEQELQYERQFRACITQGCDAS